jgi:hypothetical protein
MKAPAPERQNVRVIQLFTRAISLPFIGIRAVYRWSRSLREKLKSPERRRAEDQRRQSRVRRGLRGLGPDHVQEPAKSA